MTRILYEQDGIAITSGLCCSFSQSFCFGYKDEMHEAGLRDGVTHLEDESQVCVFVFVIFLVRVFVFVIS